MRTAPDATCPRSPFRPAVGRVCFTAAVLPPSEPGVFPRGGR